MQESDAEPGYYDEWGVAVQTSDRTAYAAVGHTGNADVTVYAAAARPLIPGPEDFDLSGCPYSTTAEEHEYFVMEDGSVTDGSVPFQIGPMGDAPWTPDAGSLPAYDAGNGYSIPSGFRITSVKHIYRHDVAGGFEFVA